MDEKPAPTLLAQITVNVLADGGLSVSLGGDVRPPALWAASAMLRNMGDMIFHEQRNAAASQQAEIARVAEMLRQPGGRS